MPRMKILSQSDQKKFDTPPVFNSYERKHSFDVPSALVEIASGLRSPINQIGFLLAVGYFKSTKRFFRPEDYHIRDIDYVANRAGQHPEVFDASMYLPRTRQRHENQILDFYGYRRFDPEGEPVLDLEIDVMMRSQLKPKLIFWRCVDVLMRERIQLPTYYTLADLILTAINHRKKELALQIDQSLDSETRSLLDALFAQESEERYARYKLTLLKRLSQSTKPTQIKERAEDLIYIAELSNRLAGVLPVLQLGHEGIQYFANAVIKSDIFNLNQRSQEDRYVHAIAFITHQHYCFQDDLVDTLLSSVKTFQNGAQREHKDWCYEHRKTQHHALKQFAIDLDEHVFSVLNQIQTITEDQLINDTEKLSQINALLKSHQANLPQTQEQWHSLKDEMANDDDEKSYYDILEDRSIRLQNRISPILKAIDLQAESGASDLYEAIEHFKVTQGSIGTKAPLDFLRPQELVDITQDESFRTSLYKVFLFQHVAEALKSSQPSMNTLGS